MTRSKKAYISGGFLLTAIILFAALYSCQKKKTTSESYFESMNTFMKVQCYGENSAKANQQAQECITKLEQYLSVTKPESDLFALNTISEENELLSGYPISCKIHQETAQILSFALDMAAKTDGAFNPCLYPITKAWGFTTKKYQVPDWNLIHELLRNTDYRKVRVTDDSVTLISGMMIDLGAVGKGFAGDKAIEIMKRNGIKSAILDLGGNVQTIGSKPDGNPWTVGIRDPFQQGIAASVKVMDKAVITSGGYERFFTTPDGRKYIHIIDSSTGFPVDNEVASVTAIGTSGLYRDALSTSLFVMGVQKAISFWRAVSDFDFVMITKGKKAFISKGLADSFKLAKSSDLAVIVVD